jgi:hypothetical protein
VLNLTLKGVEVFIERSKTEKQESYWDNYDLLIWKQNPGGFTSIKGMFRKNSWGITERISVNEQGVWKLPKNYVKYFK